MATKRNRVRKSRKNKSRKGSGLIFAKTAADNERNCQRYWHRSDPNQCTPRRLALYDYPGLLHVGKKVKVKDSYDVGSIRIYKGADAPEGEY